MSDSVSQILQKFEIITIRMQDQQNLVNNLSKIVKEDSNFSKRISVIEE
jgi:cell fate regulator YaaT (PSP1 superfamily)